MNIDKLKGKKRIEELKPKSTLETIGIKNNTSVLDYGAGAGVFAFEACNITENIVYAYDINPEMLEYLSEQKQSNEKLHNLKVIDRTSLLQINNNTIDHIILSTVFHEIQNITELFSDFDRLLSKNGKITIIDFHKVRASKGPKFEDRISLDKCTSIFEQYHYSTLIKYDLSERLYLITFVRKDIN